MEREKMKREVKGEGREERKGNRSKGGKKRGGGREKWKGK